MSNELVNTRLLYIVDDDPVVAKTIARCASSIGFLPTSFHSADELLASLDVLKNGCVVLDIRMPGTDGLQLLRILSERRPELPVIMLTAYSEVGSAVEAFRSGAIHFLSKPFKRKELLAILEEAACVAESRRRQVIDADQLEALKRLTMRERQILGLISEGMQSKQIAFRLDISVRTVDLHRSNILTKLSVRNTAKAVALAKASNLQFET